MLSVHGQGMPRGPVKEWRRLSTLGKVWLALLYGGLCHILHYFTKLGLTVDVHRSNLQFPFTVLRPLVHGIVCFSFANLPNFSLYNDAAWRPWFKKSTAFIAAEAHIYNLPPVATMLSAKGFPNCISNSKFTVHLYPFWVWLKKNPCY